MVIRKDHEGETTYRKSTSNDIYLHWQSFSPTTWKRGTPQTLVSRAFKVCSNDQRLQNEIKHLKKVFRDINGQISVFPKKTYLSVLSILQLKHGNWKKCVRLVIKICERIFGIEELSSV